MEIGSMFMQLLILISLAIIGIRLEAIHETIKEKK